MVNELGLPHPGKNPPRILVTGSPGTGKSGFISRIEERYQEMDDVKPVSLYSSKAEQGFCLFEGELSPWTDSDCPVDPKAYPAKIFQPYTSEMHGVQPGHVQPFTVPVTALNKWSVKSLVGEMSSSMEILIDQMLREADEDTTLPELISMARSVAEQEFVEHPDTGLKMKAPTAHGTRSIQHRLSTLLDKKLVSKKDSGLALTKEKLAERLRDTDTRFVLRTAHIQDVNLRVWVVTTILSMINELVKEDRVDTYPVFFVREARDILPEDSGEKRKQVLSDIIHRILLEGRGRGEGFVLDSQLPEDVAGTARAEMDVVATGRLSSADNLETVLSDRASHEITVEDKDRIAGLPNFHFFIFHKTGVLKNHRVLPPRSKIPDPGDDWRRFYDQRIGEYHNWGEDIQELNEEIQKAVEQYNEELEQELQEEEGGEDISDLELVPAELLRMAMSEGGFTTSDVEEYFGISSSSARKRIRRWRESGVVDKLQHGREVRYVVAEL